MNCGDTFAIENQDTGWTTAFSNAAASFPGFGAILGSLAQPSHSLGQIQCLPGEKFDHRTGYSTEGKLALAGIVLVAAFVVISFIKK